MPIAGYVTEELKKMQAILKILKKHRSVTVTYGRVT